MKKIDILETPVSKLTNMLFTIYRALLASDIETEEEAIFSKALIDYNTGVLLSTLDLGLEQKTIPIVSVSVWQSILEGDENLFKINVASVEGIPEIENNTELLIENIKEAIKDWGFKTFGGVVMKEDSKVDDDVSWVVEKKKE